VGAAVNAAIDRVWPAAATAAAREANERVREAQVVEYVTRAAAARESDPDPDDPDMPSEFPERWSRFLPPQDVTARLRSHPKSAQGPGREGKEHTKENGKENEGHGEQPRHPGGGGPHTSGNGNGNGGAPFHRW